MAKRTIVDRSGPEVGDDGTLFIRFLKQDNVSGEWVTTGYHRTSIPPGISGAKMRAAINTHLTALGEGQLDNTDWDDTVGSDIAREHTSQRITAYRARVSDGLTR